MTSQTVSTKKYEVADHQGAVGAVKVSPSPLGNSATTAPSSSSDVHLPAIIGGGVAALILIGIIFLGVYIWYRKKYPVRMVLGKDFQRFSNPAYSTKKMSTLKLVVEDPLAAYDVPLEQINEGFDPDDGGNRPAHSSEPDEHNIDVTKVSDSTDDTSNEPANGKEFSNEVEGGVAPERKKSKQAILVKSEDFEGFEVINEFDNSPQNEVGPDVNVASDEKFVAVPLKGLDSNVASVDKAGEISIQDERDSIYVHRESKQENGVENKQKEAETAESIPFIETDNNPAVDRQLSTQCGDKESMDKEVNVEFSAEQIPSDDLRDRDILDEKEPGEMFDKNRNSEKKGEFENSDETNGLSASFIILETEGESQTDEPIDIVNGSNEGGKLDTQSAYFNEQLSECPNSIGSARLADESSSAADEIDNNRLMLMSDDSKQTFETMSFDSLVNGDKGETKILGSDDFLRKGEPESGANKFNSSVDTKLTLDICENDAPDENVVKTMDGKKSHRLSAENIVLERPPPTPTVVYDSIILEPDLSTFEERVGSFPDVREHRSSTFDLELNSTKSPSSLKPRRSFDEYNSLTTTLSDSFQSLISNKFMDHKQSSAAEDTIDTSPESSRNGTGVNNEQSMNEFVFSTDYNLKTEGVIDTTRIDATASPESSKNGTEVNHERSVNELVSLIDDELSTKGVYDTKSNDAMANVSAVTYESAIESDEEQKIDETFDSLQSMYIHRKTDDNNENVYGNMKALHHEQVLGNRTDFANDDKENKHDTGKKLDVSSGDPALFSSVEAEYDFLLPNSEKATDGAKSENYGMELLLNFDLTDFATANTSTNDQNNFDFSNPFESLESIEAIPNFDKSNTVSTGFSETGDINADDKELEEKDQNPPVFSNANVTVKSEGSVTEPESMVENFKERFDSHLDVDKEKQSVKLTDSATEVELQHEELDTNSDFTVSTESSSSKSWEIVTDSLANLNENTEMSDRGATKRNETKLLKIDASGFNFDDIDDKSESSDEDKESLEIISEDESNA